MNILSQLKKTAKRAGFSVDTRPSHLRHRPDRELKLDLDLVATHLASIQKDVFVLQIGANDGVSRDPLAQSIGKFNWSALMLEPQPGPFKKLQEIYSNSPQIKTINVALSDHDGSQTLYCLDSSLKEPDWASGLASFDVNHLLKHEAQIPDVKKYIREIEVPCRTFDTLLNENKVERVDVLQIDTEGFDAEVLRLFDVPRRLPVLINFEHRHLSKDDWNKSVKMLLDCGYLVATKSQDTIAYRGTK
ncbi:FkbM family methyltransferase [bacterium]|nr:MAG: FkbM family methyltransferase [bacterium]